MASRAEFDLNFLLKTALEKVAFLPFALHVDSWRWRVLNGSIAPARYNHYWWHSRCVPVTVSDL